MVANIVITIRVKKAIKSGRHEDGACPLKVVILNFVLFG